MALNHLKLCKNDCVCLLSWKKSFLASQTHFCKFLRISPLSKSQSMIWFVGKCCVKYGNLSKWLESTWNFAKMNCVCLSSWKISFWGIQTHFCKFSEFHPCLSPNPWFGLWGSLVWNMVTCQNRLEITWNFVKMIAYAFFHEKKSF